MGDLDRIGQTYVDRGNFNFYLGRTKAADEAFESSLGYLSADSHSHRFSALLGRGHCRRDLRDLQGAISCAKAARGSLAGIEHGALPHAVLDWLDGVLLLDVGDYGRSAAILVEVVRRMSEFHLGDTVLAACDLAQALLLMGRQNLAWRVLQELQPLVLRIPEDCAAATAIVTLLRTGSDALSLKLVRAVQRNLETERRRPECHLLSARC